MSRLASVIRPAIEPGRRVIAISDIPGRSEARRGMGWPTSSPIWIRVERLPQYSSTGHSS
mgnify:CR=1 FL=1